jgi:hypothetical protein
MRKAATLLATVFVCFSLAAVDVSATGVAAPLDLIKYKLDPKNFSEPTRITNTWFPLAPGTQYIFDGTSIRDHLGRARVVFTVTDVTKDLNGVRNRVVWDVDYFDNQLVEEEIHFHAQDDFRNVWSFGEYPEEYENGIFIGAPSTWVSGIDQAEAGVHIQGRSRVGTPGYVQGIAPAIEFFNAAQVIAEDQHTCTPRACYEHLLETREFSPNDPAKGDALKLYAAGLGVVQVLPGTDPDQERLALTEIRYLGAQERAQANARVLELDTHAYSVVPAIWRHTPPAQLWHDDGSSPG